MISLTQIIEKSGYGPWSLCVFISCRFCVKGV